MNCDILLKRENCVQIGHSDEFKPAALFLKLAEVEHYTKAAEELKISSQA